MNKVKDIFVPITTKSTEISSIESIEKDYKLGYVHRRLKNRHIQLISIGGSIGVALYVNISTALNHSGPVSLFLAFVIWCFPIICLTCSCAEMVCYLPISSPFLTLSERCIDEAVGFALSWNFWVLECSLIPFEMTLLNSLIHYWTDDYSPVISLVIQLFLYFIINILAIKYYGEFEFWLSSFKILLAIGFLLFTFITMVGGNPERDVFGFRNFKYKPFVEYLDTGSLGKFEGFLNSLIQASFTIAGFEYTSMCAGEVINPRKVLPKAFKSVCYRLTLFFAGGALSVGILCKYNDPLLIEALNGDYSGVGSSAYTIAMKNLGIKILPNIVNSLLILSSFSAGLSYMYCSSRVLYGMSLDGKAPKFLTNCNKNGIPIYCILISMIWGCLSLLQLNEKTNTVLSWIINLVTASQLINSTGIGITYLFFRRAYLKQGYQRDDLPFKSWYQPYITYFGISMTFIMLWVQGYPVFKPGRWSIETFLFSYLMIFVFIGLFVFWKLLKRTNFIDPLDVDLQTGLDEVIRHEEWLDEFELVNDEKNKNGNLSFVKSIVFKFIGD